MLRMLNNPVETLLRTARNQPLFPQFDGHLRFGCSLTLAGYGYPYVSINGPRLPITIDQPLETDVWWNEVEQDATGNLFATGHRIADVNAWAETLEQAIQRAYAAIRRIHCLGSYYRTDIGQSLWPPGNE